MTKVTILADDLTGALDTGVKFAAPGRRVDVLWGAGTPQGEVVVLDSETRVLPPEAAARVAVSWAGLAQGAMYKKMDSTLRGPFAAEAQALARAKGMKGALYAPAFPGSGRTVIEGRLLVHGRPVGQTQFAADPAWPVRESEVASVVAEQTGCRPGHLPLELIRQGPEAILGALDRSGGSLVADAETDEDLRLLARALVARPEWLPVGSAGLAGALAGEMGFAPQPGPLPALGRGFVLICGSAHPTNRLQISRLTQATGVAPVTVGPGSEVRSALWEGYRSTGLAVLVSPSERLPGQVSAIEEAMAAQACRAVRELRPEGIFVTGGQTLLAVLRALGVDRLRLEAELAPGVVLSWAEAAVTPLQVVSKAGGFGDEYTLVRLFAPDQEG